VTTYKDLKKLAMRGLVTTYFRDGVQCFSVENLDVLQEQAKEKVQLYEKLLEDYPTVRQVLESMRSPKNILPKLRLFEGEAGIKALFRDVLFELRAGNIHQIRMLSTNTFEEQRGDEVLQQSAQSFFADLKKNKITVELFEATGGLVPEHLERVGNVDTETNLPIVHGTTGLFLVGQTIYLVSWKGGHVGLKIAQSDLSQIFHFIFDLLGYEVEKRH
jgi:hypothetical protein